MTDPGSPRRRVASQTLATLAAAAAALAATAVPAPASAQASATEAAIMECEGGDPQACMDLYRAAEWACDRGSAPACGLSRRLVRGGYVRPPWRERRDDDGRSDPRGWGPPPQQWSDPQGRGDDDPCLDPQLRRSLMEFGYCRR